LNYKSTPACFGYRASHHQVTNTFKDLYSSNVSRKLLKKLIVNIGTVE